jgi:hypothetical protein
LYGGEQFVHVQVECTIIAAHGTRLFALRFLVLSLLGTAAALYYAQLGLTLSHYDARGHLMVARRVFDNMMPGWIQLGAVWLPLPHALNALPVQWDWAFRTGATGVAISVLSLSAGLAALGGYIAERTGSMVAGVAVALAVLVNPNVLYLQSTPMTEPLLFGLACMALLTMDRWLREPASAMPWTGTALILLMLTRYEGWLITAALMACALIAHPRQTIRLAVYPVSAFVGFLLLGYGSTGHWFVASGFFEPNNPALGNPQLAWEQVLGATADLSDPWLLRAGGLGVIGALVAAFMARAEGRAAVARALLPLSLFAATVLPMYAFTSGHPIRVRYMVSMVFALTVLAAFAIKWLPVKARGAAAVLFLAFMAWTVNPLDGDAPMVRESQWERPFSQARVPVTLALKARWDGTPIMASMGSLGHYMQEMSHEGFVLANFLHEGNGDIWKAAEITPAPYVRWMLIEETAEGGDTLAQRARASQHYLEAFTRVAEGGGVALYERRH